MAKTAKPETPATPLALFAADPASLFNYAMNCMAVGRVNAQAWLHAAEGTLKYGQACQQEILKFADGRAQRNADFGRAAMTARFPAFFATALEYMRATMEDYAGEAKALSKLNLDAACDVMNPAKALDDVVPAEAETPA